MSDLNISSFIWSIADDVLRDVYVRGKYRDVILPMTVIRRLDAVLEPTKDAVLGMKEQLDAAGITNQDRALRQASGEAFYNTSPFRLRDLTSRGRPAVASRLRGVPGLGFLAQRRGGPGEVQVPNQIATLVEADALGMACWRSSWTARSNSVPGPSSMKRLRASGRAGQSRNRHGLRGVDPALQRGEQRRGGDTSRSPGPISAISPTIWAILEG